MFKTHQKIIGKFAATNPNNTKDIFTFVFSTIRERFYVVPEVYNGLKFEGLESRFAWGSKSAGMEYVAANKKELHKVIFGKDIPLNEKLLRVAEVPGLGLCKAGFVLQLCIGEAGCLDVHNLKRFGLSPSTFKMGKVSNETRLKKAGLYLKVLEDVGGCEYLWDSWCELIADLYPKKYKDAEDVSRCHVNYMM